jgi:hypothetical protein
MQSKDQRADGTDHRSSGALHGEKPDSVTKVAAQDENWPAWEICSRGDRLVLQLLNNCAAF